MLLSGKKGLVLNVVNKNSIGWAIAEAAIAQGATVGVGAQNDRMAEAVAKMIDEHEGMSLFVVDFSDDAQLAQLAEDVKERFGTIDFVVHSAAYAPRNELAGRYIDTSREGFHIAMDVSAYSLPALCRALEPVINDNGSVIALSYLGSTRAVPGYNVMGVAKAALEASVRYLSFDLGERGIRVNTLSPGPINTVAARGVKDLTRMIELVHDRAPLKRRYGQEEVAGSAVYLLSDLSQGVTGQIVFIDSGFAISGL